MDEQSKSIVTEIKSYIDERFAQEFSGLRSDMDAGFARVDEQFARVGGCKPKPQKIPTA